MTRAKLSSSFTQLGYINGAGNIALFNGANGACLSQGMVFVADAFNERIRDITFNPQPQVVSGANLGIATYAGVTINGLVDLPRQQTRKQQVGRPAGVASSGDTDYFQWGDPVHKSNQT
ncbi:MAG: hypothetical protein ABR955_08870 [Verrucomicrobiota bacterium]|jgi:hypothetical protein